MQTYYYANFKFLLSNDKMKTIRINNLPGKITSDALETFAEGIKILNMFLYKDKENNDITITQEISADVHTITETDLNI